MAITVTSDLAVISNCDTLTSLGQFYRLNGTNTGNPAADADSFVEGVACIANKCGTAVTPTQSGGHFNSTATFDITSKHLFVWRLVITAANMLAKASAGVSIGLTNTSTTGTAAWSTTNYKMWYVDGSDSMPISQGWKCYVIDPASAGDISAGTLTLTAVKNVGVPVLQTSGVTTTLSNVFVDVIRMGTGLTATASSGADVITVATLYNNDKTTANAWGIITQIAGIYYGAAKMTIGSATQANTCAFTDSSQVIVWRDYPVANTLYELLLKGASGFKTTVTLTSFVIRGQSATAVWTITCNDAFSDFKAYSSAFANIKQATLSAGSVLSGCTLSASGTITTNGASVTNCTFTPSTATTQVSAVAGATGAALVTGCTFTSFGTGHGMEITGTITDMTLTNNTWTNYTAASGGNEAVYVNTTTGTMNLTISGGTTPSVRAAAGVTVNIISGARTVKVTTQDINGTAVGSASVFLKASTGTGTFLPVASAITLASATNVATATHSAAHNLLTNDKVYITGASNAVYNGVFTITLDVTTPATKYTYTIVGNPGNDSGTATFVFLKGTTHATTGILSMSRVFSESQSVTGWGRRADSGNLPFYKTGPISGTVSSSQNTDFISLLILDT